MMGKVQRKKITSPQRKVWFVPWCRKTAWAHVLTLLQCCHCWYLCCWNRCLVVFYCSWFQHACEVCSFKERLFICSTFWGYFNVVKNVSCKWCCKI